MLLRTEQETGKEPQAEKTWMGVGLGLYITRQIVDAPAGTSSLSSQPGQGATFVVRLPLGMH